MTCHEARDQLSELLDGVLADEARRALEAHLATCADCARERDRLGATVALLHAVEPARASAGFVDRVLAATQPTPWYRRLLRRALVPWPVKLPIEAAAILLVGLGVTYLFQRTPELRDAARIESSPPAQQQAAPVTREPAITSTPGPAKSESAAADTPGPSGVRTDARAPKAIPESSRSKEAVGGAPAAGDATGAKRDLDLAAKKTESATGRERDALGRADAQASRDAAPAAPPARSQLEQAPPTASAQAPVAASRPSAQAPASEPATAERAAQGLMTPSAPPSAPAPPVGTAAPAPAPRVLPRAELRVAKMRRAPDVAGRLSVPNRDDAERALREIAARHASSPVDRQVEGNALVLAVAVPRDAYPAFARELAAIGRWTPDRDPGELPDVVQVTIRLTD